ncbi:casein kinase I RAG8 [Triangularia verruculosa]|uniref:Casein kinase I RAG8 n=1 Tax=Triangularia verruculosa TaxID=2587418 RepID=A0AAN6XEY7_9PEZI|nr:casein kinase I RAG8 [Triangularia verruculosa]
MLSQALDLGSLAKNPYEVGSVLTFQRTTDSTSCKNDQLKSLRVRIKTLQQPWTLSCCMIVDILCDSSDEVAETAFLKLFDWRYAAQQRSDNGIDPWSPESAVKYAEFVVSGEAQKFLDQLFRSNTECQDQETEEDWNVCQDETFLVHETRTMYNNETTVYRRLQALQGTTVPRLMGAVELDIAPPTMKNENWKKLLKVQGVLLEYSPDNFTLRDLVYMVPTEDLQGIVDQAVDIVRSLGDYDVLNSDVRLDNFLVTCQRGDEGIDEANRPGQIYRVVMLDFAQSRVRRESESDFEWGRAKARQDEEGAIGLVVRHHLRKHGKEVSYEPSGRYDDFLETESESGA